MDEAKQLINQPSARFYLWRVTGKNDKGADFSRHQLTKTEKPPTLKPDDACTYLGRRDWAMTWFAHYTFDTGQSDVEACESFDKYVSWVQTNHWDRGTQTIKDESNHAIPSLMGAEDRHRWCADNGGGILRVGQDGAAPCRCEHCKKQGVLRICH